MGNIFCCHKDKSMYEDPLHIVIDEPVTVEPIPLHRSLLEDDHEEEDYVVEL